MRPDPGPRTEGHGWTRWDFTWHAPRAGRHELVEEPGGDQRPGDPVPARELAQLRRLGNARGMDGHRAAVQERPPDLGERGVEGDGAHLEEDLVRRVARVLLPAHQPHHGAQSQQEENQTRRGTPRTERLAAFSQQTARKCSQDGR